MTDKQIKNAFKDVLGHRLKTPRVVALGYEDEDGVQVLKVPNDASDSVGKYFIHELPGKQAFVGEAYLEPGRLPAGYIRYGMPVRVQYDPLYNDWTITGTDPVQTAEYVAGVDLSPQEPLSLGLFQPGLLDQTAPASMKAVVYGAPYTSALGFDWWETQETQDFTGDGNIPTTNDTARYCLVQLNELDGTLDYKYATATCNARLTHQQAKLLADDGTGNVVPDADSGYWRVGYIKLINGMTEIKRNTHIWAVQEIFSRAGSGDDITPLVLAGW